jgi:hypothetical protein
MAQIVNALAVGEELTESTTGKEHPNKKVNKPMPKWKTDLLVRSSFHRPRIEHIDLNSNISSSPEKSNGIFLYVLPYEKNIVTL